MIASLIRSEKRLKDVLDSFAGWVWEVDAKGKYTFVSGRSKELLGYSPEELIGKTPFDLMPKEEAKKIGRIFKELSSKKKPIRDLENWNITKDGKEVCLLTNAKPLLDEKGKLLGYQGVDKDITKQKKIEESLKHINEETSQILNTSAGGIRIVDKNFNTIRVNKIFIDMVGADEEQILNKKCYEIFPGEACNTDKCSLLQILKGKKKVKFDANKKTIDGTSIPCAVTVMPFKNSKGKVIGVIQDFRDITQRKKAEENLKSLKEFNENIVENIPSAMLVINEELKLVSANNAFYNIYAKSKKKLIGKTISKLFSQNFINKVGLVGNIMKVFKNNKIIEEFGIEFNVPYLGNKVLNIKYIPLINWRSGNPSKTNIMVLIDDITEMKKLEKHKKLLSDKVSKLTSKIPLTNIERIVFYGLIKYPLLSDSELSKRLKIKRSTVTSIKNKLLRHNFYTTYVIPDFGALGCELLCAVHGKAIGSCKDVVSSPEMVYCINTDRDVLGIMVSKSFVETKQLLDSISNLYDEKNIEPPDVIYFPFESTQIPKLLDYSTSVGRIFDLNIKDKPTKFKRAKKRELSKIEKVILYALTKYPNLPDKDLAYKTKISRQTISKIKKKFLKENLLTIVNKPNTRELIYELLVCLHTKNNVKNNLEQIPKMPSNIFTVSGDSEAFGIFLFENYAEHRTISGKLSKILRKGKKKIKEPKIRLFSTRHIQSEKMDFASLVKKIFNLKVDF